MTYPLSLSWCRKFLSDDDFFRLISFVPEGSIKFSVNDFLKIDHSKLRLLSWEKKIDFEKLKELQNFYRKSLFDSEILKQPSTRLKCCISKIDNLFMQIAPNSLIEITGPSLSGKSILACSIALDNILRNQSQILFVDADLSLTINRFKRIFPRKFEKYSAIESNSSTQMLKVFRIFLYDELMKFLEYVCEDTRLENSILIIDSINSFVLGDQRNCFRNKAKLLSCQLFHALKTLTLKANLTVIYTKLESSKELRLGSDIDHPDLRIFMEQTKHLTKHQIIVSIDNQKTLWSNNLNSFLIDYEDFI